MSNFFKDLYHGFLKTTMKMKITFISLIALYIILLLSTIITVNYEVVTPGSPNAIVSTKSEEVNGAIIKIDTEYSSGKIYTIGVHTYKPVSLFQYVLSKLSSDINEEEYDPNLDFSSSEEYKIGVIQKNTSIYKAMIIAYEAANKYQIEKNGSSDIKISYEFEGVIVANVRSYSESNLKVNDLIIELENTLITSSVQFSDLITNMNQDDYFKMKIIRDGKLMELNTHKVLNEGKYILGINVIESYKVNPENTYPAYTISDDLHSIGSSGGAMTALAIFESLTQGDITNDKYVYGTGTINLDGTIGKISGVPQKVTTAMLYGCEIFFVGESNYEEAKASYDMLKNPGFDLVRVSTFNDIISYLDLMGDNHD